jgi:hypothetical protein
MILASIEPSAMLGGKGFCPPFSGTYAEVWLQATRQVTRYVIARDEVGRASGHVGPLTGPMGVFWA